MAHKAETAVQGWSVDPMEDAILTHRVLATRSTVRLFEFLTIGKSFSLVLCLLVVMVTAQASVVILLNLHPQARAEHKPLCSEVDSPVDHTQHPADDGPQGRNSCPGLEC